jgi:acyl-CoA synthetase (AMP-forming)/AMP-acid ligase II
MSLRDRIDLVRQRDLTLGTLLERMLEIHGDRRLVEEHGSGLVLTYGEAAERVARMAQGIKEKIDLGDAVVIAVPNGYELFLLCLAACRAGGRAVPVNPKMREAEIKHVIDDSGAPLVVRDASEVMAEKPLTEASPAQPEEVAAIFYTSGTTGKPKGAELTHRALLGGTAGAVMYPSGLRRDEVVGGMPVAHIAGFSLLVMSAVMGIPTYLLPKFRPDDALDAIESRRATVFIGVPAMYRMMLEAGAEERDLRSIRLWASGADAMPDDLVTAFKKMGATVTLPVLQRTVGQATFIDGYGMVELSGGVAVKVSLPVFTLPMIPLPGYKLKVIDDEGNEVARGAVGELAVKGPGVLKGYHGNRQATDEVLTSDGWLRTGDLGRRGLFGLVTFAGRKKHVIKHGGYSVFAVEVEKALEEHPDILEAAVVGLPDERKGEVPAAAVRVREGADLSEDDLVAWAREHLADYKAPRQIRIVEELPRTATDKVQKDELLELFGVTAAAD